MVLPLISITILVLTLSLSQSPKWAKIGENLGKNGSQKRKIREKFLQKEPFFRKNLLSQA